MITSWRIKLLFILFVISGFSGLIYESIWSHYLKLFLGHAAYAQTLVLTIFMGGMALGAWVAGRMLTGGIRLLYAYALVELIIGMAGIAFHPVFQMVMDVSFNTIIPAISDPKVVHLYRWTVGSALLLPQSILLGATFPLMSNGLLRIRPDLPGRSISLLYFGNSIGAAMGVLVCGFYLIAKTGMPGTVLTAGIINVLIAVTVYMIAKGLEEKVPAPVTLTHRHAPQLILAASFLTGTASFIYELVWIRMLSMVLGASTHSFELMLSAFITGLAFGGLWIRNRLDRLKNPLFFGSLVQVAMGITALSTLLLYDQTYEFMGFLIRALEKNESGYSLFLLGSHSIALLIMLPTTFLAGMTLPLFTLMLLKDNCGEKSVSQIYVSNMLGAIAGVVFTVFIGMPILGLKGSMVLGSGIDLLLGLVLLFAARGGSWQAGAVVFVSVLIYLTGSFFSGINPKRVTSGVFRSGLTMLTEGATVPFYEDGKTASVTIARSRNGLQTIATNGKPDASVYMNNTNDNSLSDESTQVLVGAIPLSIHPDAKRVAIIGIGSGGTAHSVLAWPGVERLDTIEIEAEMVAGAKYFKSKTWRVFSDPRSIIHLEDARAFLSGNRDKYDLIISEPSNPWISGVASLYTREFYGHIKKSLNTDGYLAQWLHLYEFNELLLFSVLKAISEHFQDFRIYATRDGDIVIIARQNGMVTDPQESILMQKTMQAELTRIGVNNLQDITTRYQANRWLLEPYISKTAVRANSDYFPFLDLYAPKSRFMHEQVSFLTEMMHSSVPISRILLRGDDLTGTVITPRSDNSYSMEARAARQLYRQIVLNEAPQPGVNPALQVAVEYLRHLAMTCAVSGQRELWLQQLLVLATATLPYLPSPDLYDLFKQIRPTCPGGLPAAQQNWLDLISALIQSDYSKVSEISLRLNPLTDGLTPKQRQFLLQSRLLSLFMTDNAGTFAQGLQHYRDKYTRETLPHDVQILEGLAKDMQGK